jgi:Uncharacterized conserved protein
MKGQRAECRCGALQADCSGDPVRVSVCHCLSCKRRTGSAFSYNATYASERVQIRGVATAFTSVSDEGHWARFHFCPACGATVWYEIELRPGMVTIPVGAFADPAFPAPTVMVYSERAHSWCVVATDTPVREE